MSKPKLAPEGAQRFDARTKLDSRHVGSQPKASVLPELSISKMNLSAFRFKIFACGTSSYQNSHVGLLRHDNSTLFLHFFSLPAQLSSFVFNGTATGIDLERARLTDHFGEMPCSLPCSTCHLLRLQVGFYLRSNPLKPATSGCSARPRFSRPPFHPVRPDFPGTVGSHGFLHRAAFPFVIEA